MIDLERHIRHNIPYIRIPQRVPFLPSRNTKLTSLLRQHTTASHSLNIVRTFLFVFLNAHSHHCQAEQYARETVQALRTEVGVRYSADVPMDQVDVVD